MKRTMTGFFALFLTAGFCTAQEETFTSRIIETAPPPQGMRGTPANLPDISVIGVFNGYISDDKSDGGRNKLEFDEVETAFQGYIYPKMRADVFLALHKHDDEYEAEICEAKTTFLEVLPGLSAQAGKIHVDIGRLNKSHSHHRPMVDQPPVITNFFGEHGLVGQGLALSYLLPLPFYAELQGGAWTVAAHHSHIGEENTAEILDISGSTVTVPVITESDEFGVADKTYTGRLLTSFALSPRTEMLVGLNALKGRGSHYEHHRDEVKIAGADFTLKYWPSSYVRWTFQNEWFQLNRRTASARMIRDGFYSLINYRWSKYWDAGLRLDYSENAMPVLSRERMYSVMLTRHLTETTHARLQYRHKNIDGDKANEGWVQLSFGIGPHSHELE